jgi:biotin carboxyl carrier protein
METRGVKPGRYTLRLADEQFEATLGPGGRVETAGRVWTLRQGAGGAWTATAEDGQVVALHAVADGDVVWVHAEGHVHLFDAGPADATRTRRRAGHAGDLSAPMPAVVRAILVEPGDRVSAGDVLVMLEAMKMELPVRSPRDALVSAVLCGPGDLVQPGAPLVELS